MKQNEYFDNKWLSIHGEVGTSSIEQQEQCQNNRTILTESNE